MFFWLFSFFFTLIMVAVSIQLLYSLAVVLAPLALVGFGCWVVYRLVRGRG